MIDISNELEEQQAASKNTEPFFKLPYESTEASAEKKVHEWLINDKNNLLELNKDRFDKIKKHLALNKGMLYKDDDRKTGDQNREKNKKREYNKITINALKEANRIRASRLLKYKPAVAILPTNDELADKIAADMCEKLVQHIWYVQRFDGIELPRIARSKGICGEMYLFILWNPELGDVSKQYKAAEAYGKKENLEKVPLLGADGKPEKDDQGQTIWVEKPVMNGDVEYSVENPLNVLIDRHPTKQFKNSRHLHRREVMNVEEARLKYPKAADKIKADKDMQFYDYEDCHNYTDPNSVELWHFFHKRHSTLDKGRYIVYSKDGIVANEEFPYSHRDLPCIRWVDIENEGEMHASSFFEDVKGINAAYNNVTNMILRNEYLVGHPKWMMPAGAADIRELGNSVTIVQFKGPVEPKLVQANPTGQGAYTLRQTLKDEISQNADVSRTGNGEPPKGITAAVALQFLSESEAERWNEPVLSHNERILQTTQMSLAVASDYYHVDDERMIRVQGLENEWQTEFFDSANLSKDYDVRVQNTSALAESKSARTQTLLDLGERYPNAVDQEQVLDMLDFAQSKKFIKEATISTRSAEAENESLMAGKKLLEPENYEDHVIHWRMHVKKMREWQFKNRADEKVKKSLEEHVMAHEMFMTEMAMKSPAMAQKIALLEGFPLFFEAPPLPPADPMAIDTSLQDPAMSQPLEGEMPVDEGQLTQEPGAPVNEQMPNLDQQMGLESGAQEPTNSI